MKYVMFETDLGSGMKRKVPIIFPDQIAHAAIAEMVIANAASLDMAEPKVINAGEINMFVDSTHGKSVSCQVLADESDADTINAYNYFHGLC